MIAKYAFFSGLCVYLPMLGMVVVVDYRVSTMVTKGPLPENEINSRNTASTQLRLH